MKPLIPELGCSVELWNDLRLYEHLINRSRDRRGRGIVCTLYDIPAHAEHDAETAYETAGHNVIVGH